MHCSSCSKDKSEAEFEPGQKTCKVCIVKHTAAREQKKQIKDSIKAQLPTNREQALQRELDFVKGLHPTAPSTIEPTPQVQGRAVACMVASDWHIEEPVDPSKVHSINAYNLEIAKQRSEAFFRNGLRLTNIMADSSEIDTIYLMFVGDFFSNYLHEVLREINLLGPAEAANYALQLLSSGVKFLLKNSPYKLIIDCIPGNHGRMTKEIRSSNATETSLETFMYQSLATFFADETRVTFRVANSKMLYRQFFGKFNLRLIHGDDISFGGGVGGVTIPIRKRIAAWDKAVRADLTVMGHFHQFLDGGDFIVNGSLIGYNEYAQAIGASPEDPRQAFFLLHERKGGSKSIVAPIWLDK